MDFNDDSCSKRFWSKIIKRGENECWPWTASKPNGYGQFWCKFGGVYKRWFSHRLSLAIKTGVMPEKLWALHSCDNPSCCNPAHLRWGTDSDNLNDRFSRNVSYRKSHRIKAGDQMREANRHKRLLTDEQVLRLRGWLKEGRSKVECAALLGVRYKVIYDIARRGYYADVA